ncbi:unnamed protein product [Paramecium octaurelia]|uniref:NACHT domain-containing protein n=1 Tax=Paramecium octaurelia TaxID=43137 RepID=A0A8S1YMJ0_PAROT|nr:unnamed protein product [Paramecium octaurelia]
MNSETNYDKSNLSSILFGGIHLDNLDSQFLGRNNMAMRNGKNLTNQFYQQNLRGGGCCINNSRTYSYKIVVLESIPAHFGPLMEKYSKILDSKALSVYNKQDKLRVISSIQWFINNQKHFNTLCLDQQQATKFIRAIKTSLELLLNSILNYITISGYICIEVLSQCNVLVRVLFCYYSKHEDEKLNSSYKEKLENYLKEFESLVNTNVTQCWEFGIEFEISIMKTALSHIPTKSEKSNNFTLGILQSIAKCEISDKLVQQIFNNVKEILQKFVGKIKNPIENYEVYNIFEGLKWNIVSQITQRHQQQNIKGQLNDLYIQFIKNSQDWMLHCCWIKLISELLTYRPIVDMNILLSSIANQSKRKDKWKDLIKHQCIEQLPYKSEQEEVQGKCISFPNRTNSETLKFLKEFSKIGLNELAEFQQQLMNQDKLPDQQFWQFYALYKQKNDKDNETNKQNSQIQNLFNFIPIFQQSLDYLKSLLENNQIIIEKVNKLINTLAYEIDEANLHYQQELENESQKIESNTIESIYMINEIHIHIIMTIYYLGFIKESLVLKDKFKFNNIVQSIKDTHLKEYEKSLKKIPNYLMNFLKIIYDWKDTLKNFQRDNVKNPFQCIPNIFDQFRKESENIFERVKEFRMIFEDQIHTKKLKIDEFILIEKFEEIIGFEFQYFFTIFLNGIISNIKKIIKLTDETQNEKKMHNHYYYSFYTSLKISRFLLHIMQVRFQKNEPYQVMEVLSSRRYGTIEDETQNQTNFVKILLEEQKEYIENLLSDDSKEQKEISIDKLIDLVNSNINQIKNTQINDKIKNDILKKMTLILFELMKLPDFQGENSKNYIRIICKIQYEILSIINQCNSVDKEQNQSQRGRQSQRESQPCQKSETLLTNFDSIANNLMILMRKTEFIIHTFEIKNKIQSDQTVDNSAEQTRKKIIEQMHKPQKDLYENKRALEKNLKSLFFDFPKNYDTQIPYLDIYQFFEILQSFDLNGFHHQVPFEYSTNDNQPYINLLQFYKDLKQANPDPQIQQREEQKIKQCLCYNLIKINNIILEENLQRFSKSLITRIWIKENDYKVKQLLQNEEMIEIQTQLYLRNFEESQQEIERQFKERLSDFDECHTQILQQVDGDKIEQLKIKLQEIEKDLSQYILNINDMQDKLKIKIIILLELKKQFNNIKQQLQELQFKLNNVDQRIARLIWKTPKELFDIRKKNFEFEMNKNGIEELHTEQQFNYFDKEEGKKQYDVSKLINMFIEDTYQYVMLIHGRSGIGKTTAMNKIEQYIWKNYSLNDELIIIPISAQLSNLQTPTTNLFKEILMQNKYGFNENQIEEFKQSLTQTKQLALLLLDSYDEMPNEFKYQNLYVSNRFSELKNKANNRNAIKFIISCRTEFIKSQSSNEKKQDYIESQLQTWFGLNRMLREVELLEFDDQQIDNFLQQYTQLSVIKEIQNSEKIFKQLEYKQFTFFECSNDWRMVLEIIKKCKNQDQQQPLDQQQLLDSQQPLDQQQLLNCNQLDQIINYLIGKNQCLLSNQNYINQMNILRDNLSRLWNAKKYKSFSNNLKLGELMRIPYLIKMILKIVPTLTKNYNLTEKHKHFEQNYFEVIQTSILSNKISSIIKSPNYKQQSWKQILKSCNFEIEKVVKKQILSFQSKGLFRTIFNSNLNVSDLKNKLSEYISDSQSLQLVINAIKQEQITVYDFIDRLTSIYLEKQILRLKSKGKIKDEENFKQDVLLFANYFSLEMIQNQELSIQYQPQGQLQIFGKFLPNTVETWYDKYFHDQNISHDYYALIRSSMLITQRGSNLSFSHEKITQFYVAKAFYSLINSSLYQEKNLMNSFHGEQYENNSSQNNFIDIIRKSWINNIQFNLSKPQYKEAFEILKEKVKMDKAFQERLIWLIQKSAKRLLIPAASNIISFLGFVTKNLSNIPLDTMELKNTSLIGIDFSNSDLSDSIFQHVNISDCNFTNTKLNGANWKNTINYNIKKDIKNCSYLFQFRQQQLAVIYKSQNCFFQLELEKGKEKQQVFSCIKSLKCFDISQNGEYLAYVEMHSQVIYIRNLRYTFDYQPLLEVNNFVEKLYFSKEQEQLASASNDKIIIWKWQRQEKKQVIDVKGSKLRSLLFSYGDTFLALNFEKQLIQLRYVKQWDRPKFIKQLSDEVIVFAVSFDEIIASVSSKDQNSKIIQLYNIQLSKEEIQLKGHQDKINCLVFLENKRTLISGGDDCFIILWNYQTGKQQSRVQIYPQQIQFLNIGKNNRILGYYNQYEQIKFLDLEAFQSIHQVKHPKKINQIHFSNDGLTLLTFSLSKVIKFWDMKDGKRLKIKDLHDSKAISIILSVTDQFLASANEEGKLLIYNFKNDKVDFSKDTNSIIKKIKFSQDEEYLVFLSENKESQLTIINWKTNEAFKPPLLPQNINIVDFCFSADSTILIFAQNTIYCWNYLDQSGDTKSLQKLKQEVIYFEFSQGGHYFATYDTNNELKCYKINVRKPIKEITFKDVKCIVFSRNEEMVQLAIGGKGYITIIDMLKENIVFQVSIDQQQDIEIIQFSPIGFLLASVFRDNTIKIFDISEQILIFSLTPQTNLLFSNNIEKYSEAIIQNFLLEDIM